MHTSTNVSHIKYLTRIHVCTYIGYVGCFFTPLNTPNWHEQGVGREGAGYVLLCTAYVCFSSFSPNGTTSTTKADTYHHNMYSYNIYYTKYVVYCCTKYITASRMPCIALLLLLLLHIKCTECISIRALVRCSSSVTHM